MESLNSSNDIAGVFAALLAVFNPCARIKIEIVSGRVIVEQLLSASALRCSRDFRHENWPFFAHFWKYGAHVEEAVTAVPVD